MDLNYASYDFNMIFQILTCSSISWTSKQSGIKELKVKLKWTNLSEDRKFCLQIKTEILNTTQSYNYKSIVNNKEKSLKILDIKFPICKPINLVKQKNKTILFRQINITFDIYFVLKITSKNSVSPELSCRHLYK